jgi:NAD(P)-dependent dehydrogenase (short-subunit alcohol dehydrogenase family)
MEAARAEIESLGVRAIALPLDIGANSSVEAFYRDAVAAYGKIDILVNAAGASARHP